MKINNKLFIMVALLAMGSVAQAAKTITSSAIKLVPDGKTVNTAAIQRAIDDLSRRGGGTLIIQPGQYVTGTIEMKSNTELHLEQGATLLGSLNPLDYIDVTQQGTDRSNPAKFNYLSLALIEAYQATNIKLTGQGTIDARGCEVSLAIDSLHKAGVRKDPNYFDRLNRPREAMRPNLFTINGCDGIEVSGLRLRNAACWGLVFFRCKNLKIEQVDVHNRAYWNNDGIDIVDCHHVVIRDSHVDAADDGICLKSDKLEDTNDDIQVYNCSVESSASAIKFGTNSAGGFQNITIRDIKVSNTFRSAVAIEAVDGAIVRNVLIENIQALNTGNPIFIRLGQRHADRRAAVIDGVTIRNMVCEVPFERPDVGYKLRGPITNTMRNPMPSSIVGIPGVKVRNVLIDNVTIIYPGGADKGLRYLTMGELSKIPEQINRYPEFDMFGELPCYGFYVRHADGVTFRNVNLLLRNDDFRPAFVLDDASNVKFENISYPFGKKNGQIYDNSKQ